MGIRRLLPLSVAIGLLAGAAWAEGMKVDPGKWRFETTTQQPMAPQPTTRTSTECVEDGEIDPSTFAGDAESCTIFDVRIDTGSMKWKIRCAAPVGKMTGLGRATSTGATVTGSIEILMQFGAQQMKSRTQWKGERIGECN